MEFVSSSIIPLHQQQKNLKPNSRGLVPREVSREDSKSCYILFLSLSFLQAQQTSAGYTQPRPSWVKLVYLESKDVVRPKFYLIRSGISASTLQSVAAPHHTPFPLKSESGSSHRHSEHLLSYTTVNEHLLPLPDCSTLRSRNNLVSAQVRRSDQQVKAPFHNVPTVYFSRGEDNSFIPQFLLQSGYQPSQTAAHH